MKIFGLFVTIYWDNGELYETEFWEETYVMGIFLSKEEAEKAQETVPEKVREYLINIHKNGPIEYYPHCRPGDGFCIYDGFCTKVLELATDQAYPILCEHAVNSGAGWKVNHDDLFPKERPA